MRGARAVWALALIPAPPLAAQPVAEVDMLPKAAVVVDIRDEEACLEATLPGARCLPATVLFEPEEGPPISFPALRWYLGTLGVSGAETVAVFPGSAAKAHAVAALLYLAGQREVVILKDRPALTGRGESRSFSRQAVYTAPMRTGAMRIAPAAHGALADRLNAFARGQSDTVAFAPGT